MSSMQYAAVAKQLQRAKSAAAAWLTNVRAAARYLSQTHGYALENFAKISGLHRNTVMKLNHKGWEPSSETLAALNELIVEAALKRAGKPGRSDPARRGRKPQNKNGTDLNLKEAAPRAPNARVKKAEHLAKAN